MNILEKMMSDLSPAHAAAPPAAAPSPALSAAIARSRQAPSPALSSALQKLSAAANAPPTISADRAGMAKQIVMAIQMQARRDNRGMLLIANFQKLLAVVGLPVAVDGIYGPQTAAATRRIAARMNAASLPLEVQVASVISAASRAMTQPGAAPLDPSRMAQPVEPRAAGLPNVPMPGAQAVQTVSIEPKFVQPAPISAQIVPAVKPDIYAGQPDSQTVPAVPGKIYDPRAPQLVDEPKADGGIFGMAHGGGIFGAAGQHVA